MLTLSASKEPFHLMLTGEKKYEFRKASKWIESRLYHSTTGERKHYTHVKFINGYGKQRPYVIFKFLGLLQIHEINEKYSTGLQILEKGGKFYCIKLGNLIKYDNLIKKDVDSFMEDKKNPKIHMYRF